MIEIPRRTLLERYQWLIEISRDLATTFDLNDLLNRIVIAAANLSNALEASILLYDEIKGELFFQAATNEPLMRGIKVPVGSSIAGWIVTNREPIIIGDVEEDRRHFKNIAEKVQLQTTSLLGVPLIAKNKVIGALEAINKKEGHFNLEDQEILMTLGAQAAIAIENARLFQQSDLIAEFVHELKTPLSSINTASQLLLYPQLPEEKRLEMVQVIQNETSRLSTLSNSYLNVARLESGRVGFDLQKFPLQDLLEECASLMQPEINQRGQTLQRDYQNNLPVIVGDYDKLKQAVINLLSNATKYNRPAGDVILRALQTENIVIEIEDTGIGIADEYIGQLFQKFYRVPGSENISPGTGLGLIVVKQIVEGHKGRIDVKSQQGVGAKFSIILPAK